MTLILTEVSNAGVAMAADSAITYFRADGSIDSSDRVRWTKLLKGSPRTRWCVLLGCNKRSAWGHDVTID